MTTLHLSGTKAMLKFIARICEGITYKEGFNNTLSVFKNEAKICDLNFSEQRELNNITIPVKADAIKIFCDYIDYLDREEAIGAYLINDEEGQADILAGVIPLNPKSYEEKTKNLREYLSS